MRKPPLQDVIVKTSHSGGGTRRTSQEPHTSAGVRERPRKKESPKKEERPVHRATTPPEPPQSRRATGASRGRWLIVALVVGAVVVVCAFILSLLFAGASVTVYPKQDTVVVNASFVARGQPGPRELSFERMVLEQTAVREVIALEEQDVEERASGKITIFNNYSDTPQRLIKNTRFQADDGSIYRIRESVEVPGRSGGEPGFIDATVYAEEPGEAYNRAASEFSIPGFVGLPQEGKVYAQSVGDITGGFQGIRRTIDEADRLAALEALESQLRDELLANLAQSADVPAGYRTFSEAVFFEFSPLPDEVAETDKVRLSLSGKLHALLFAEMELAERLAEQTIGSYEGSPIRIDNIEEVSVSLRELAEGDGTSVGGKPWEAAAYTVTVTGKTKFIWLYDESLLAQELAGKDRVILDGPARGGILDAFPGIDRINASVRPFWKSSFPDEPQDIVVITELDE